MNGEIKYRVWDNENKSYNDPYPYAYYALAQDGGLDFYCHGDHMDEADPNVYLVELYTGLKDKNGKEIYVGDIVRVGGRWRLAVAYTLVFCAFELQNADREECMDLRYEHTKTYEVIGNIHENPELLKEV